MNKEIIETEAHNLFELLRAIIVEQQTREKLINQNSLRVNRSYRIGFTQAFIFLILLTLLVKLLLENRYNFTGNIVDVLIVFIIFCLLGAILVSISIPGIVGVDALYKDSKESTQSLINRIEKDNIFIQKSAKKVSKFIGINIQTLESVKTDLKLEIDIIQSRKKILDSLAPLLAVLVVAVIVFILGINIQDIKLPVTPAGLGAVTPPLIFQFLYKRQLQDEIINLKKCIAIIEQAQALTNKIESK